MSSSVRKYIRNKVIYFSLFLALGIVFFASRKADAAHQNAVIICLIDDMSNSYKTQVFYTGKNIEMGRISQFLPNDTLIIDEEDERLSLLNFDKWSYEGGAKGVNEYPSFQVTVSNEGAGQTSVYYYNSEGKQEPISFITGSEKAGEDFEEVGDITYDGTDIDNSDVVLQTPLTFPADITLDATAADINRAYTIADTLGGGFNDALSFINGGKSFTSVNQLISTAYGLCIIENGGTYTNSQGLKYSVTYNSTSSDGNGYSYKCKIQDKNDNYYSELYGGKSNSDVESSLSTKSGSFVWKMKKGYKKSAMGQDMEDGVKNQIANRYSVDYEDTTYITWQHLFLQAGILYSEGVTYANQSDIYTLEGMESSITDFFRKLLDSVSGFVNVYSMEELIFNKGVRGTQAFYMGTFNRNFESYLLNMFLIFAAISVSLVFLVIIRMIMKKQLSTANKHERASFLESVKDLLISLFFMAFSWGAIKLLMILNYRFVDIFSTIVGDKTLQKITAGGVIIGGIVVKFTYFILEIYINYVYIIRGLVIAALIIVAPLFIIAFNFGQKGKEMFWAWFRELTGSIFLQSMHALVYGIIIVASVGSRGIEGIVMIAAIIPLTSMFKTITGSGGDTILQTAASLTRTTGETMGSMASVAGQVAGSMAQGMGNVAGTALETFGGPIGEGLGGLTKGLGQVVSGATQTAAGVMNAGIGTGLEVSTIGGGNKSGGWSEIGSGLSKQVNAVSDMTSGLVGAAGSGGNKEKPDGDSGGPGGLGLSGAGGVDASPSGGGNSGGIPVNADNHAQRKAALDAMYNNDFMKEMKGAKLSPQAAGMGDGSWTKKGPDGRSAAEQSYAVPLNTARKDLTDAQIKAADAIRNYKADRADGNLSHFNKQYGSDYARVHTETVEGKQCEVITFGKYLDTAPQAPASQPAPQPQAPVQQVAPAPPTQVNTTVVQTQPVANSTVMSGAGQVNPNPPQGT